MLPIQRALPALALVLLGACGRDASISLDPIAEAAPAATMQIDIEPESATTTTVVEIQAAIVATAAVRGEAFLVTPTEPPEPTGINGLPFAPPGLEACDEMMFYAKQFGMPDWFRGIGWRESNCRNEDGVKTYCCHGYLQLYISLHLKDHRLVDGYHACGVYSKDDVNSNNQVEKQRHMCAASVLYDVMGSDPWRATR